MKKSIRILTALLVVAMLATTAFAAQNAPSAEAPSAEQGNVPVVTEKDNEGMEIAGVIRTESGEETAVPADGVIISGVGAKDVAPEVKEMMDNAFEQIKAEKDLTKMVPELKAVLEDSKTAIADALKAAGKDDLAAGAADLTAEDLVIRDLIDVSLTDEYAEQLKKDGNKVTIKFDLGLKDNEVVVVLHNYEADKWEAIPAEDVEINKDGSVTVTFSSLSPVAFAVGTVEAAKPTEPATEATEAPTEAATEAPTEAATVAPTEAPAEKNSSSTGIIVAVVIVVLVVVAIVLVSKNKKKDGKKEESAK